VKHKTKRRKCFYKLARRAHVQATTAAKIPIIVVHEVA
jgi:hypothetical protein